MKLRATAHPVQGMICAHGYQNERLRTLPVEAVFCAVGALELTVTASFDDAGPTSLPPLPDEERLRLATYLRELRLMGLRTPSRISIEHNLVPAIGLGSSAALYAAIAASVWYASGRSADDTAGLSASARLGSYSAGSAVLGGVSRIRTGTSHQEAYGDLLLTKDEIPLAMIVLRGNDVDRAKRTSSELHHDIVLSPYYERWSEIASKASSDLVALLRRRDFDNLRSILEPYMFANAAALATGPNLKMTWSPSTSDLVHLLRELRAAGEIDCAIAMNSGPAVFAYVQPDQASAIAHIIAAERPQYPDPIVSAVGGPPELAVTEP